MAFPIAWILDKMGQKMYAWASTKSVMDFDRGGETGQTLQKTLNDLKNDFATTEQGLKADSAVQTVNGKIGPNISLIPVLLWENSQPNAAFEAQTINLNTGDYTYFLIIYSANDGYRSMVAQLGVRQQLNSATYYNFIRPFRITNGQVQFESGQYYQTYGSGDLTTYKMACIPWKIIGLM